MVNLKNITVTDDTLSVERKEACAASSQRSNKYGEY
jgi:hypothetical protein